MAGKGAVAARERARLAKVQRYADRAAREAKVEDTVTEFYLAADAHDAALAAMTTARAAVAAQVEALLTDLKEPVSGVAVLCDITAAQVRALRKEATTPAQPAQDQEPASVETSNPNEPEPDGANGDNRDFGGRDGPEPGADSEQKRAS